MVKKTETKKETGKSKAAPAKKARTKKAPVAAEKKEVTKDAPADVVEEVLATPLIDLEKEPKKVENVVEEIKESVVEEVVIQQEEPVTELETTTEEVVEEPVFSENEQEENVEQNETVEDVQVEEEPVQEDKVTEQAMTPRDISGAKEEFITENAGDEIETENISVKTVKKSAEGEQPKRKNRIMRYLSYLWNGVEID